MLKSGFLLALLVPAAASAAGGCPADPKAIAALDTEYQAAVEKSDAAAMDRLLADDFTLVLSTGTVHDKAELLAQARDPELKYEQQRDTQQTVRFFGSTAVITAYLRIKGSYHGKALDTSLWFSDVYACTPKGWVYSFGQAGAHTP